MCRYFKSKKGYTLIEVILSIAILAMIVVPFSGLFLSTTRTNSRAEDMLNANQLAQEYMERYRALSTINSANESVLRNGKEYTIRVTVGDNVAYGGGSGTYARAAGQEPPAADAKIKNLNKNYSILMNSTSIVIEGIVSNVGATKGVVLVEYITDGNTLNVRNESDKPLEIYIVNKSSSESSKLNVITELGEVYVIKNAIAEAPEYNNWLYSISVEVFKGNTTDVDSRLVVLNGVKRAD